MNFTFSILFNLYGIKIHGYTSIYSCFPNVIGCIDGCHVRIAPRKHERGPYFNFKKFHSVHLQAVCLYDQRFTDIFVGCIDISYLISFQSVPLNMNILKRKNYNCLSPNTGKVLNILLATALAAVI